MSKAKRRERIARQKARQERIERAVVKIVDATETVRLSCFSNDEDGNPIFEINNERFYMVNAQNRKRGSDMVWRTRNGSKELRVLGPDFKYSEFLTRPHSTL